ncbi:MAG: hypothetical protein NDP13_02370 [Crenarchaeota archaeon]|nr:hypothetical protein [Thermoproteota archaeon]
MDLNTFYKALLSISDVKWVIIYKNGDEIINANIDSDSVNLIIKFMNSVIKSAESALNRILSAHDQISFLTIYLQSGLALLFVRYEDYNLIVTIRASKIQYLNEMKQMVERVKKLLEGARD